MASPSISENAKTPSLSYAERAKKAQNIKSSISVKVQNPTPTPSAPAPPTTANSTASTVSSARGSDTSASSSVTLPTQPPSPATSTSNVPDTAVVESKLTNGHSQLTPTSTYSTTPKQQLSNDLAVKALSIVAAHPSTQKSTAPLVNIWSKRMEQMAAARATPPQNPSSSAKPSASLSQTASDNLTNVPHGPGPASAKQKNGITPNAPSADNEDPFVVRIPKHARIPPTTLPTDSEHWPEVGKSIPQPLSTNNSVPHNADQERAAEAQTLVTAATSNRKGEKTKWIPIPPQELQAAADAYHRSSRSQSRRAQQSHRNTNGNATHNTSSNANNNVNTDGQASGSRQQQQQHQNKDRSGRNSNSQSVNQSATHSRVQSRAASVSSSPRLPRGRQLPDEAPVTGTSGYPPQLPPPATQDSVQPHAFNTNSPSQSHVPLQPSASTDPTVYPTPVYGLPPNEVSTYYPPPLAHPHHYRHSSHSPGYPPSGPAPASYPPYPMYTPYYDYGASTSTTPPYPYWTHSHPGSGHQTPAYVPQAQAHYSTVPPVSTSTNISPPAQPPSPPSDSNAAPRPPAPSEQSEPVAAYRAVPDADSNKQMAFGSIDIPGASQCPSPAPSRPDVSDLETSFSSFMIGIEPGEAGPSRLKTSKSFEEENDNPEGKKWEFGTAGSVDATQVNGESRKQGDLEVKDFGYGFGSRDIAPEHQKREHGSEVPRERGEAGPPMSPTSGRGRRGYGYDRGGFGGRRGRGMNGYWRGYGRYPRGGGGYRQHHQHQHIPFNGPHHPSPPHFPPMVPLPDPMTGYLPPPRQQLANYMGGFEPYQPVPSALPASLPPHNNAPLPTPVTTVPFHLDPTRWHLLGQLEYYLSPQNMAQDFFLRKQMDSRGWIPIPLIASFNRVKSLTGDMQLVRNVLTLSSIVQVKDDKVRMGGWERYVLPDAPESTVDDFAIPPIYPISSLEHQEVEVTPGQQEPPQQHAGGELPPLPQVNGMHASEAQLHANGDNPSDSEEEEIESEEEVEFVLGHEAGGWSPEQSR